MFCHCSVLLQPVSLEGKPHGGLMVSPRSNNSKRHPCRFPGSFPFRRNHRRRYERRHQVRKLFKKPAGVMPAPKPGTQRRLCSLTKIRVPFCSQKESHIQRQERKHLRSMGCYVRMSGKKKGSAPRLSRGSLTQEGALPPAREKNCPKMGLQHWEPVFVTRSGMLNSCHCFYEEEL